MTDFYLQRFDGITNFSDYIETRPSERLIYQQHFSFREVERSCHIICRLCPLSSKVKMMLPTIIRYQPNALKPYLDTIPINDFMAIIATIKPTAFPAINRLISSPFNLFPASK